MLIDINDLFISSPCKENDAAYYEGRFSGRKYTGKKWIFYT